METKKVNHRGYVYVFIFFFNYYFLQPFQIVAKNLYGNDFVARLQMSRSKDTDFFKMNGCKKQISQNAAIIKIIQNTLASNHIIKLKI